MVVSRIAVDLLLQTREASERFDMSASEVELSFGDVSGVIGDRVCNVVAGHCRNGEDRHGTGSVQIDRLFVSAGQLAVEVAGVASVGGDLLHDDGDFLHRVGEGGHIGQQDEDFLALERETLADGCA